VCPVGAILPKHTAYNRPIGKRLYDKQPISIVGDVAVNDEDEDR
jgi:[NiFe] hydrogenase diaphorase moiety small subunit